VNAVVVLLALALLWLILRDARRTGRRAKARAKAKVRKKVPVRRTANGIEIRSKRHSTNRNRQTAKRKSRK